MADVVQALVSGIGYGAIDALLALGIVFIYRVSGIVNFAQAGIGALAGYCVYSVALGRPLWLGLAVGMGVGAVASVGVGKVTAGMGGSRPALNCAVATLAIGVIAQQVIRVGWGNIIGSYPTPWGLNGWTVGAVAIPYLYVAAILAACLATGTLLALLRFTRPGAMVRAIEDNSIGASLCGGNVTLLVSAVWAASGVTATLAAFFAFQLVFEPAQLDTFFVGALVAAVAAGLRSLPGAVVAGVGLETAKTLFGLYAPGGIAPYAETFVLVLLVAILLLAPSGRLIQRPIRTV